MPRLVVVGSSYEVCDGVVHKNPGIRVTARDSRGTQGLSIYPPRTCDAQRQADAALVAFEAELEDALGMEANRGRALGAARLEAADTFDLEMMREMGYCPVSKLLAHLARRAPGASP